MKKMNKDMLCSVLVMLALVGVCSAETLLLGDTFDNDGANTQDFNTNLVSRQSGTQATVTYGSSTDWQSQIGSSNAVIYGNKNSCFVKADKDFATISSDVRLTVDVRNNNLTVFGFAMINVGLSAADGYTANKGYSFRLDNSGTVNFFDNGVNKGSTNITLGTEFVSFVIDFTGGDTISATVDGEDFLFTGGATSYTGTSETENYVELGRYAGSLSSSNFDNLTITDISSTQPATIVSFTPFSSDVMCMVVDAPSSVVNYFPQTAANLPAGGWTHVAHSVDGSDPFVITNLSYSTADGTNEVIYVRADDATAFFGISNE